MRIGFIAVHESAVGAFLPVPTAPSNVGYRGQTGRLRSGSDSDALGVPQPALRKYLLIPRLSTPCTERGGRHHR